MFSVSLSCFIWCIIFLDAHILDSVIVSHECQLFLFLVCVPCERPIILVYTISQMLNPSETIRDLKLFAIWGESETMRDFFLKTLSPYFLPTGGKTEQLDSHHQEFCGCPGCSDSPEIRLLATATATATASSSLPCIGSTPGLFSDGPVRRAPRLAPCHWSLWKFSRSRPRRSACWRRIAQAAGETPLAYTGKYTESWIPSCLKASCFSLAYMEGLRRGTDSVYLIKFLPLDLQVKVWLDIRVFSLLINSPSR